MRHRFTRWLGRALLFHLMCASALAVDEPNFLRKDIVGNYMRK